MVPFNIYLPFPFNLFNSSSPARSQNSSTVELGHEENSSRTTVANGSRDVASRQPSGAQAPGWSPMDTIQNTNQRSAMPAIHQRQVTMQTPTPGAQQFATGQERTNRPSGRPQERKFTDTQQALTSQRVNNQASRSLTAQASQVQPQWSSTYTAPNAYSGTQPQWSSTYTAPNTYSGTQPQWPSTYTAPNAYSGTQPQWPSTYTTPNAYSGTQPQWSSTYTTPNAYSGTQPQHLEAVANNLIVAGEAIERSYDKVDRSLERAQEGMGRYSDRAYQGECPLSEQDQRKLEQIREKLDRGLEERKRELEGERRELEQRYKQEKLKRTTRNLKAPYLEKIYMEWDQNHEKNMQIQERVHASIIERKQEENARVVKAIQKKMTERAQERIILTDTSQSFNQSRAIPKRENSQPVIVPRSTSYYVEEVEDSDDESFEAKNSHLETASRRSSFQPHTSSRSSLDLIGRLGDLADSLSVSDDES